MRRRSRSSSSGGARRSPLLPAAVLGVVVAGLGSSTSGTAHACALGPHASTVAIAERHAAEAFEAYQRHDYGRALLLYQQAMAAAPSADIAYNIARVYDLGLHDPARAIEWYERYIAFPGAAMERVERARARADELRATEHGDTLRRSPEQSSAPDFGRAPGATRPAREPLPDITRDFPLDVIEPARQRPPPAPRKRQGFAPLQTAALTLGSMGLVGVGVGVGFALAARAQSDDWRRDCDGNQCSSSQAVHAAESAARSANIATVGFAAGGGLLALGAALWLIDSGSERPERARALQVEPMVQAAGGGALVSGSF
jgi:hypothetical protein